MRRVVSWGSAQPLSDFPYIDLSFTLSGHKVRVYGVFNTHSVNYERGTQNYAPGIRLQVGYSEHPTGGH